MRVCVCRLPMGRALTMAVCCWTIFCASPTHAASEETISAARICAQKEWADKAGYERAEAYREAVDCLRVLYIRVAAGEYSNEALETELTQRLRNLEKAYHTSRGVCRLQEKLGLDDQGCGTISLSPREFVRILKTMILNADAGWVRQNPALAEALGLAPEKHPPRSPAKE